MRKSKEQKEIKELTLECDTAKRTFADQETSSLINTLRNGSEQVLTMEQLSLYESRIQALPIERAEMTTVLDVKGTFNYVSSNYQDILGYEKEGILGKNIFDFVHPEDVTTVKEEFGQLYAEKRVKYSIYRFRHQNGKWCFLQSSGSNLLEDTTVRGIVINSIVISDLVYTRDALNRSNERFEILMNAGSESIWDYNLASGELFLSDGFRKNFGIKKKALHKNLVVISTHLHKEDKERVFAGFEDVCNNSFEEKWICDCRLLKENGEMAYAKIQAVVLRNHNGTAYRAVGTVKDVTAENFHHKYDLLVKEVMEYNIFNNLDISNLLTLYIKKLEELLPDMKIAVMRIKNNRVMHLASQSIPQSYLNHMEGLPIGKNSASCGTAAYLKEKVVVADVQHDGRWKDFMNLAKKNNIKACWSYPIFNADGEVIATFANYCATTRMPNALEEHVIDRSQRLISLFIEKFKYLQKIQKSNERYELVNKASRDAIYEWDAQLDVFYWNESFYNVFGYEKNEKVFRVSDWAALMHPADDMKLREKWNAFLNDSKLDRWEKEFRFKKADGTFAYAEEIGLLIRDIQGKPLRMIGVLRDVSLAKINEKQNQLQNQVSQFFKTDNTLQAVLSEVLQYLTEQGELQTAELWLTSADEKYLNLVSLHAQTTKATAFFQQSKHITRLSEEEELLPGHVWKDATVKQWNDITENHLFARREQAKNAGLKSAMGMPLFYKNKVIGVLLFCAESNSCFTSSFEAQFEPLQYYLGDEIKRKQKEEEMFMLFHSAPEIMAIVSQDRRFVKVNPAFYSLLGYTEEEITSQSFDFYLHPSDVSNTVLQFREANATSEKGYSSVSRYRTKSGDYRWISWSSSAAFGNENMVFAYGRDVTKTVELQGLLENASKMSRVGGWEIDVINDVLYWSSMTKIIHEVAPDFEPIRESAVNFYPENFREELKNLLHNAISQGEAFDFKGPITTAKGNQQWIRTIGQAEFCEGVCIRIYGSIQDIHNQKITEIELHELFEKHNTILESIGDAFFAVNQNWVVTYWNKQAEEVMQRKRESVIGKSLWDAYPDAVGLKFYTEYHKAMNTGEIVHFEEYYASSNQWFEVSVYPSREGLSIYFKDVSIRKIAQEAIRQTNERFEKVTEATSDAIWDWDIIQDTYYRSDGFERLFGCKIDSEESSKEFWQFHFSSSDKKKIRKSIANAIHNPKTSHWEMEYGIKRKDGSSAYVIDRGIIIRNQEGIAIRMIGAMTDITYRKQYEESLKSLNLQLEHQTKELITSNKELEQFAYVASHDLQEPLRMITNFLTQLTRKYGDQLDEKAHQYIHFAVDGSLRMRQIILDILEFSKVGKHEELKEKVDLNEVVSEACALQHRLIEEKKAVVNCHELPTLILYRSPVLQVFQNLIGNALKYSKPNVPTVIEIFAKELPNAWEIAVKDNGIGISKEYYDKIFILFQRLHAKDQYSGTGIGLAIVKKILDAIGGQIRVEATEGLGSTFYFTLPKRPKK